MRFLLYWQDKMMNKEHENKKKGRVVWSVELHNKFLVALNQLGIDKAVPRKILELMNDENLTKQNVSSHLQKYKLHLKRLSSSMSHHQQCSLSDLAVQNVREFPSSATNQFGQINNTNGEGELNFQSAIDGYQNGIEVIPTAEWFPNQCPHSLTDMHTQIGVFSTSTPSQVTSNEPFECWNDPNQDSSYHSNFIGAVDPEGCNSTNSTFNNNLDFNFCDPLQMKNDGIMDLTEQNYSLQQHQVYIMNQHKSLNSSPDDLVTASSSCSHHSQWAEIAELKQEMAATRYENHQLREIIQAMMARQDMLMQVVLQVVPHEPTRTFSAE